MKSGRRNETSDRLDEAKILFETHRKLVAEQKSEHQKGVSPILITKKIATSVQHFVVRLYELSTASAHDSPEIRIAILAAGGLGRREMAPYSDIDLIIVSDQPESDRVKRVAENIFYPLWDAKFEVGHAVRSPEEFLTLAQQDDRVRTTAIDWRPLAGEASLLGELETRFTGFLGFDTVKKGLHRSVSAWIDQIAPATVYRLEPDLKNGPGGLRDLQWVWWAARVAWKITSWDELCTLGPIDPHDRQLLMESRDTILDIRLALHFLTQRRQEQLLFEFQRGVAEHLSVKSDKAAAEDQLLQTFYTKSKNGRLAASRILEQCLDALCPKTPKRPRSLDLFLEKDDRIALRQSDQFEQNPVAILQAVRASQLHNLPLDPKTRTRINEGAPRLLTESVCSSPTALRVFLDILSDPRRGGKALEELHQLGVLERMVPEFERVHGLVQRDTYHTYTVDAHLVYCAKVVMGLLDGTDPDAPSEIRNVVPGLTRRVLVLAALLHDIGKGQGKKHSEVGAEIADSIAQRFLFSPENRSDLLFLVKHHLSMFRISQRRDLEDRELIKRFASEVETVTRLNMLLVLSYADAVTTGPKAWNDWKASLLMELYFRTRNALQAGAGRQRIVTRTRARLRSLENDLLPEEKEALAQLVPRLPARHWSAYRTKILRIQLQTYLRTDALSPSACRFTADERREGWEAVIVSPDRSGLLAELSAVFAARGMPIASASISGTHDGVAIDTFSGWLRGQQQWLDPKHTKILEEELVKTANGEPSFKTRLDERVIAERALRREGTVPEPKVVYDLHASGEATVVDVIGVDRVGLLHDLAKAISSCGVSITLARITTEGERAVDGFYLVDGETKRPLSEQKRDELERAILKILRLRP